MARGCEPSGKTPTPSDASSGSSQTVQGGIRRKHIVRLLPKDKVAVRSESLSQDQELAEVREEPRSVEGKDKEVLEEGKKVACKWPVLASRARRCLGMPASSVPSEAVFSLGSRTLTTYRRAMENNTLSVVLEARRLLHKGLLEREVPEQAGLVQKLQRKHTYFPTPWMPLEPWKEKQSDDPPE